MKDRIKQYRLSSPVFNPVTIQMTDYTPQAVDVSILANRINNIETKERLTNDKISAIDEAFGAIREKLPRDEKTTEWLDNLVKDYKSKIQTYAQFGDYDAAINTATKLAGEVKNNAEINNRIQSYNDYNTELNSLKQRIGQGISQSTYKYIVSKNQYSYDDNNPDKKYTFNTDTYDDINYSALAKTAFDLITPYKSSVSSSGSSSVQNIKNSQLVRGNKTYEPGESISSSYSNTKTVEKIDLKDIRENIQTLVKQLPGGIKQVEQAYNVAKFEYDEFVKQGEELQKEYNNLISSGEYGEARKIKEELDNYNQQNEKRKELFFNNGSFIDYKTYFTRMIAENALADNLAFDWKTTSTSSNSSYTIQDVSEHSNRNGYREVSDIYMPGYQYDPHVGKWIGPEVGMKNNTENLVEQVNGTAAKIVNRYKK